MGVIRPRPPASQNLASDRAANLADRQQIRRLLSRSQKPVNAAVSGVYGTTKLTATSPHIVTSGSLRTLDPGGWTVEGMDWLGGTPPGVTVNTMPGFPAGAFSVDDAGLYSMHGHVGGVVGGTPPTEYRTHWNPSPQDVQNDEVASINTHAWAALPDGDFQWSEFVGPFVAIPSVPSFALLFAWYDGSLTLGSLRMEIHVTRVA